MGQKMFVQDIDEPIIFLEKKQMGNQGQYMWSLYVTTPGN